MSGRQSNLIAVDPGSSPEIDPVRAAASDLLEALRPLWEAGKLKGPTGHAVAALERALHA
ncbi:MAG TPA: hypothetical protein VF680_01325 [Allosphingosinicella sp.]